jgi:hypothetical protein
MLGRGKKGCYCWKILKMEAASPSETSVTINSRHEVMSKGCLYEAEKVRYKERQVLREIFLNSKWIHINDKITITTILKN